MLTGGNLVMLGLGEHAELPQLLVQFLHVSGNTRAERTEIMVVQLLTLGRLRAEQRTPAQAEIHALEEQLAVNEEILLLRADLRDHLVYVLAAEQMQQTHRLAAEGFHRAQQRRFFIERIAAVGAEDRWDAKASVLDESECRGVPRAVAARFKGRAQTAGGERRGVRLTAHQLLAGKIHDDPPAAGVVDEAVVLLSGHAAERLKPMGKVRRAALQRPRFHRVGDLVGGGKRQRLPTPETLSPRLHCALRHILLHRALIKDQRAKQLGDASFFTHAPDLLSKNR